MFGFFLGLLRHHFRIENEMVAAMKYISVLTTLLCLGLSFGVRAQSLDLGSLLGQTPYESPSCMGSDYHELDFMHGIWDMKILIDGKWVPGGFSVHRPALGGCVSFEVVNYENWGEFYRPLTGRTGIGAFAINSYDRVQKNWRQIWLDDMGSVVANFRGKKFKDGIRFVGQAPRDDGSELQRFEWRITGEGLREFHYEQSTDGGKEWVTLATVQMVKRRPRAPIPRPQ